MKTFHVITKYISQYNDSSESDNSSNYYDRYDSSGPLYAFESLEEAQYVLHLLQEEDPTETYELHTLNNDHPFPKLSEEEMLEKRLTRDIHERAHKRAQEEMKKQKEYDQNRQNRLLEIQKKIDKKQAEEEAILQKIHAQKIEIQQSKLEIDEFLDWIQDARNNITHYDPIQEELSEDLLMTPTCYVIEATHKMSLLKDKILQYLMFRHDQQMMELLDKSVCELLNVPPTTGYDKP